MNRVKIAVLILVISVILGIASLVFIQQSCGALVEHLDIVINYTKAENITSASDELQSCVDYYEKIKPWLNILVGQGEAIEIRGDLNKAIFFINIKDYESAVLYLQECKTDLNRIIVSNTPSISTIL